MVCKTVPLTYLYVNIYERPIFVTVYLIIQKESFNYQETELCSKENFNDLFYLNTVNSPTISVFNIHPKQIITVHCKQIREIAIVCYVCAQNLANRPRDTHLSYKQDALNKLNFTTLFPLVSQQYHSSFMRVSSLNKTV